tara:strand:+ start:164 stop:1444 length:1281 start_codon:yes stop_codon:yes gene_type:complete
LKNRYLASNFLFYGFATGINKGVLLIAIPLLSGLLTLEEYGLWSLSQVIIAVLAPIVSLNGYSSILRYGVEDKLLGVSIFKKYIFYTLIISVLNLLFFILYGVNWISLTFLLAQLEGFQALLLGWTRSRDYNVNYLIISLIKITSIALSISLLDVNSLDQLLIGQLLFGAAILFSLYIYTIFRDFKLGSLKLTMKKYLSFSLFLIPHNVALWILSSSDRFIIKNLLNEFELGLYSLAYSLALLLMLVNSGIALALPNFIIKNYSYYIKSRIKIILISIYSLIAILTNLLLYLFIYLFHNKINYLAQIDDNIYQLIIWIFNGIYLLGLYYFYSNILFYNHKAKLISLNTFGVSLLNVLLTIILVDKTGIMGAAIATFVAYLVYLILNVVISFKIEERVKKDVLILSIITFFTLAVNFYLIYILPSLN